MFQTVLEKLKSFFASKTNITLAVVLLLILSGAVFGIYKYTKSRPQPELPVQEIDLSFDPEGPYALIVPRRDGNAVILNILRTSTFDSFSYQLTYQSAGSGGEEGTGPIDRGAGDLKTFIDLKGKSEFSQEILFGTCSKGDSSDPLHCVFDKNVENGSLALNFKSPVKPGDKFVKVYKMTIPWHLQKPDVALGVLTSADGHLTYKTDAKRADLSTTGYSLINELSGAPKIPDGKQIVGKIYSLNVPTAKSLSAGAVTVESLNNPPANSKISVYDDKNNSWHDLDSKIDQNKISANVPGYGIIAVFAPK